MCISPKWEDLVGVTCFRYMEVNKTANGIIETGVNYKAEERAKGTHHIKITEYMGETDYR